MAQTVKHPLEMRETWVQIPGLGRSPGGGHGNPLGLERVRLSTAQIIDPVLFSLQYAYWL